MHGGERKHVVGSPNTWWLVQPPKMKSSHNVSADIAISIAGSVDHPSVSEEPHTKKPRLLARYNTEEAVAKAFGTSDE